MHGSRPWRELPCRLSHPKHSSATSACHGQPTTNEWTYHEFTICDFGLRIGERSSAARRPYRTCPGERESRSQTPRDRCSARGRMLLSTGCKASVNADLRRNEGCGERLCRLEVGDTVPTSREKPALRNCGRYGQHAPKKRGKAAQECRTPRRFATAEVSGPRKRGTPRN